ncbi:MAG: 4Fe-4S binding protein [Anaerolineales bacterium]|nr:4Fe-4S binding protein [Anaerolineales bacterium]
MMMQVDPELCTGCGNCVAVCPNQAISLMGGVACIDAQTCTRCEACVDACPTGAIHSLEIAPAPVALQPELVVYGGKPLPASGLARFAPVVGATLTYLGREFVPRLADTLFNVVENRLSQPSASRNPGLSLPGPSPTAPRRGQRQGRRRQRRRGLR